MNSATTVLWVATWVILLLLGLGLGGCLRAMRLLSLRIDEIGTAPRRLAPGDALLGLPEVHGRSSRWHVLIFARAACRSCRDAIDALAAEDWRSGADLAITVLLSEGDPIDAPPSVTVHLHQQEVFKRYHIGLVPFGVLADGAVAKVVGGLASKGAIDDFETAAAQILRDDDDVRAAPARIGEAS